MAPLRILGSPALPRMMLRRVPGVRYAQTKVYSTGLPPTGRETKIDSTGLPPSGPGVTNTVKIAVAVGTAFAIVTFATMLGKPTRVAEVDPRVQPTSATVEEKLGPKVQPPAPKDKVR